MPRIFKISEATLKEGKMALNAYNIPLIGTHIVIKNIQISFIVKNIDRLVFGDHSSFGCITCIA